MTIYDLRCDRCGDVLTGPALGASGSRRGVRFRYHPGTPELGDDAGLLCERCWQDVVAWSGTPEVDRCSRCGADLRAAPALVVAAVGEVTGWLLCTPDALELLNSLRTVEPKLDPETFRLPVAVPRDSPVRLRDRPQGPK